MKSDPTGPGNRLAALANTATPEDIQNFKPAQIHWALAGALSVEAAASFTELAEKAGVSRSRLYEILNDPAATNWIVAQGTRLAHAALGAVHARLLHLALTSRSPAAIKLYLQRFDPEFKEAIAETRDLAKTINSQLNFIQTMSPTELENFIALKRRRVLGADVRSETPTDNP